MNLICFSAFCILYTIIFFTFCIVVQVGFITPHFQYKMCAQSCLTLCDPMDWSPPGSSLHGISQARILEWVAIFSSRRSSQPRDRTSVSYISWIGRHALESPGLHIKYLMRYIINSVQLKPHILNSHHCIFSGEYIYSDLKTKQDRKLKSILHSDL